MRAHRAQAGAETLLVFCPSYGAASSAESILLRQTEEAIAAALAGVPGLQLVSAAALPRPLRGGRGRGPRRAARPHRAHPLSRRVPARAGGDRRAPRLPPPRAGPQGRGRGLRQHAVAGRRRRGRAPKASSSTPATARCTRCSARLTDGGVLVCLCSKNEEPDVWRVFETRPDLGLRREQVVAAMINWQPKSQNLRALAARLNLGLDSFVFIDDNPVECAEVRANCPEVLTLQWPQEPERAERLTRHIWELDAAKATKEDARRTALYQEEFKRQEARAVDADVRGLHRQPQARGRFRAARRRGPARARRSSRCAPTSSTSRPSAARKPTCRRSPPAAGTRSAPSACATVSATTVSSACVIAERGGDAWNLDTFLLSCRVLGRGVEHRIVSDLGRMAAAAGARAVNAAGRDHQAQHAGALVLRVDHPGRVPAGGRARRRAPTSRRTCSRAIQLRAVGHRRGRSSRTTAARRRRPQPVDASRLRRREEQIARSGVRSRRPAPTCARRPKGRTRRRSGCRRPAVDASDVADGGAQGVCRGAARARRDGGAGRPARGARLRLAAHRRDHGRAERAVPVAAGHAALRAPRRQQHRAGDRPAVAAAGGPRSRRPRASAAPAIPRLRPAATTSRWSAWASAAPAPTRRTSSGSCCARAAARSRRCRTTGRTSCARSPTRGRTGRGCSTASAGSTPSSSACRRARPRSWTRSCGCSSRWPGPRSRMPARPAPSHDPATGVFAGVMYGDYGYRANAGSKAAAQPVPLLGRVQPREPPLAAARLPRPEPGRRHRVLVVGHRAPPGVQRAQGRRVPRRHRRRREPDSRSRPLRLARAARHPVEPRRVRAVRRRRRRHRARRGRRRGRAAAARRRAAPRRSHLRRHQGHRAEHRQRHRRLHGAQPAGAGRGDPAQPARRARRSAHHLLHRDARHRHAARRSDRGARADAGLHRSGAAPIRASSVEHACAHRVDQAEHRPPRGRRRRGGPDQGPAAARAPDARAVDHLGAAQPADSVRPGARSTCSARRPTWPQPIVRDRRPRHAGAAPGRPQLVRRRRRQRARHRRGGAGAGCDAAPGAAPRAPGARAGALGASTATALRRQLDGLAAALDRTPATASRRPRLQPQHRPEAPAAPRRARGVVARRAARGDRPRRRSARRRGRRRSAAEGRVPVHRPGLAVRRHGPAALRHAAGVPRGARPLRRGLRRRCSSGRCATCCSPPRAAPTASC